MVNNERNITIDVTKGIGIILVVLGHIGIAFWGHIIYQFHMALFFMLSGYCFKVDYLNNKKQFIVKRSIKILWPYLFFLTIRELMRLFGYGYYIDTYYLFGTLWFLRYLFVTSIVSLTFLYVLCKIFGDNKSTYIYYAPLIMLILTFIINVFFPNISISSYTYVSFFFLLGFSFKNISTNGLISKSATLNLSLLTALLILSSIFSTKGICHCDWETFIPYGISSIIGSYLMYLLAHHLIEHQIATHTLSFLGANTMPIVLLQWPAIALIDVLQYYELTSLDVNFLKICKFLAGIAVPLIIAKAYSKCTFLHLESYIKKYKKQFIQK